MFKEYTKKDLPLETLLSDISEAIKLTEDKLNEEQDKDKKEMYVRMLTKTKQIVEKMSTQTNSSACLTSTTDRKELLDGACDILSTWLDKKEGKSVTDNSIFSKLPRHYEGEFHKDMAALNV